MRAPSIALFTAVLFALSLYSARADFDAGLAAFEVKDYKTAFSEWKAAADQGEVKSQYRLGKLYEEGRGVPQNYVQAHLYYNLAGAKGDDEALVARDAVAEKMVKEELAEARKLAAAWRPIGLDQQTISFKQAIQDEQEDSVALFRAAYTGDARLVEALLAGGAIIQVADADGRTPLMFAAGNGHINIINLLLNAGSDLDVAAMDGSTALFAAALGGHADVVKGLIAAGAEPNKRNKDGVTPLILALKGEKRAVVDALLDGGADANLAQSDATTSLMLAILGGQKEAVTALLETDADIDATNHRSATALMAAAHVGDLETVKILLDRGANAEIENLAGATAFDIALANDNLDMAKVLLGAMPDRLIDAVNLGYAVAVLNQITAGADANQTVQNGWSPLMLASARGDLRTALVLIAADANVSHANKDGVTALMLAALNGHMKIVKALIQAGANQQAKNNGGLTAYDIAEQKGHSDIVALIYGPTQEASKSPAANVEAQVRVAQKLLADLGYDPGPVDGLMGNRTRHAIRRFERNSGMSETGKVSERLVAVLRSSEPGGGNKQSNTSTQTDYSATKYALVTAEELGVTKATEMDGASVCVTPGTQGHLHLVKFFRVYRMEFQPVTIPTKNDAKAAVLSGRCDAMVVNTTDDVSLVNELAERGYVSLGL